MTLPDFKGQFMPAIIPAAVGTYIVELGESGAVLKTPVIAWAPDAENPYRAPHPITVDGLNRLTTGRAILHPGGMVHSRDFPLCFESIDEWKVIAEKGPRTGGKTERPTEAAPSKPSIAPSGDGPELKIEWITTPFKQNSFYRYTADGLDFIFNVEGGVNPPKQKAPVKKIKRDEFMELKKTVDVAEVSDLMEGRAPGLDTIGSFEDDDDLMGTSSSDEQDDEDDLI